MLERLELALQGKFRQHIVFQAAFFWEIYVFVKQMHAGICPVRQERLFLKLLDKAVIQIHDAELAVESAYDCGVAAHFNQFVYVDVVYVVRIKAKKFVAVDMLKCEFYRTRGAQGDRK